MLIVTWTTEEIYLDEMHGLWLWWIWYIFLRILYCVSFSIFIKPAYSFISPVAVKIVDYRLIMFWPTFFRSGPLISNLGDCVLYFSFCSKLQWKYLSPGGGLGFERRYRQIFCCPGHSTLAHWKVLPFHTYHLWSDETLCCNWWMCIRVRLHGGTRVSAACIPDVLKPSACCPYRHRRCMAPAEPGRPCDEIYHGTGANQGLDSHSTLVKSPTIFQ